jgi:phage baseplate assembly protein W
MMINPGGISFPFRFTDAGGVRREEGIDKVQTNMIALAKTTVNERLIRKQVGTIGYSKVLRNLGDTALGAVKDLVRSALNRFESRALITRVKVYKDDTSIDGSVFLDVDFIFRDTGKHQSLTTQLL